MNDFLNLSYDSQTEGREGEEAREENQQLSAVFSLANSSQNSSFTH
jgi:hypothetical protein